MAKTLGAVISGIKKIYFIVKILLTISNFFLIDIFDVTIFIEVNTLSIQKNPPAVLAGGFFCVVYCLISFQTEPGRRHVSIMHST